MRRELTIKGLKKDEFKRFRTFYNSKRIKYQSVKSTDDKDFTVVLIVNETEKELINSYLKK